MHINHINALYCAWLYLGSSFPCTLINAPLKGEFT